MSITLTITYSVRESNKSLFLKLIRLFQVDQWLPIRREKEVVQQDKTAPNLVKPSQLWVARVSNLQ